MLRLVENKNSSRADECAPNRHFNQSNSSRASKQLTHLDYRCKNRLLDNPHNDPRATPWVKRYLSSRRPSIVVFPSKPAANTCPAMPARCCVNRASWPKARDPSDRFRRKPAPNATSPKQAAENGRIRAKLRRITFRRDLTLGTALGRTGPTPVDAGIPLDAAVDCQIHARRATMIP